MKKQDLKNQKQAVKINQNKNQPKTNKNKRDNK